MSLTDRSSMNNIKAPHWDVGSQQYSSTVNDNDRYGVRLEDNTNISNPASVNSQNRNNQNYREIGVGVYLTPDFIGKTSSQMNNLDSEFRSIFTVPLKVSIARTSMSSAGYRPPSETINIVVDPNSDIIPNTYYFQSNNSYLSSNNQTLNMAQTDKGGSNL